MDFEDVLGDLADEMSTAGRPDRAGAAYFALDALDGLLRREPRAGGARARLANDTYGEPLAEPASESAAMRPIAEPAAAVEANLVARLERKDVSLQELKALRREAALRWHPDRQGVAASAAATRALADFNARIDAQIAQRLRTRPAAR